MQIGDTLTLIHGLNQVPGIVRDLENYRRAYLVFYQTLTHGQHHALAVVFPEYQYLPPSLGEHPDLYAYTAYCAWQNHYWPVAAGRQAILRKTNLIQGIDPRELGRQRVDHVLDIIARTPHFTGDIVVNPQDDREYREWRKWYPSY